jgi:hypothetical protein
MTEHAVVIAGGGPTGLMLAAVRSPVSRRTRPASTSKPPHDYSYMRTAMKSAITYNALVKAGVRDVRRVWADECGGGRLLIVVSITQRFCGHSRQAGAIAAQCRESAPPAAGRAAAGYDYR